MDANDFPAYLADFIVRFEKHGKGVLAFAKRHQGKDHIDGKPLTRADKPKMVTALIELERCGRSVPQLVALLREYHTMLVSINAGLAAPTSQESDEE